MTTYAYNIRITDWRDSIRRPVIDKKMPKNWDLNSKNLKNLEAVLTKSICDCTEMCLKISRMGIVTTLSGGIDSAFCLWVMRKNFPLSKIHTFTTGESVLHPDIIFAREMARICKTEHHELIPSKSQVSKAKNTIALLWPGEENRLGNVAVFMTYQQMAQHGVSAVIAHDGIDEQLGGYPDHRWNKNPNEKEAAFLSLWGSLEKDHLQPLENKAKYFGIRVIFPYLQERVVRHISRIPIDARTSKEISKIPLRALASSKRGFPRDIIERPKKGFCDALNKL